jgi:hypothetical protein
VQPKVFPHHKTITISDLKFGRLIERVVAPNLNPPEAAPLKLAAPPTPSNLLAFTPWRLGLGPRHVLADCRAPAASVRFQCPLARDLRRGLRRRPGRLRRGRARGCTRIRGGAPMSTLGIDPTALAQARSHDDDWGEMVEQLALADRRHAVG